MSLTERVKQGYLRLPKMDKLIFVGSILTMTSVIMPWYDNKNSYGIGESYLGIQGPLFMIGMLTLLFSGICFFKLFLPFLGRNFFKSSYEIGKLSFLMGLQSLLMLIVANSIFYHPDFGGTVANKVIRFGMFFAFLGTAMLITGGYFASKRVARPVVQSYEEPKIFNSYEPPRPAFTPKPMELDAREKYKMMSREARTNLWSGGQNSPFARLDNIQKEITENQDV